MNRARYPNSSDPAVIAAQRGAAFAKSIAAVAILGGILAVATLAARDVPRSPSPLVRSDVSAPTASAGPTRDAEEPTRLDPREAGDHNSSVHGSPAPHEAVKAPIPSENATPHFERSNDPAIEVDLENAHGG